VEQVVALVELHLDLIEALDLGLGQTAPVAGLGEEVFLLDR
jgi:hypothetical protein